jgi:hypothetical protein
MKHACSYQALALLICLQYQVLKIFQKRHLHAYGSDQQLRNFDGKKNLNQEIFTMGWPWHIFAFL